MKLGALEYGTNQKAFKISLIFLLVSISIELIAILILNSGRLIFTLDDAYIHLSMAENIAKFHYGINLNEFSSPSSSILWAFLIAPFAGLSFSNYIILFINIICSVGTLYLFWKILTNIFGGETKIKKANTVITFFLILLIISTNMIPLIFIGMEHPLQIFLVTLIIWGLIYEIENDKVTKWLIVAIILAPLIRYENLAVSFPALIYLYFRGYHKSAIVSTIIIIVLMGTFVLFLLNLGLSPLPTSVRSKLATGSVSLGGGSFGVFIERSLNNPRGILLTVGMLFLLYYTLFKRRNGRKNLLAGVTVFGITLHLLVGKYGSFHRYEIYILTVAILVILYLNKELLTGLINNNGFLKLASLFTLTVLLLFEPFIKALIFTPLASNNIYEQQYQMHRFAVEYYNKPVAVNDLGFVTYNNPNYVLDLWGLASAKTLQHRGSKNSNWIDKIAKEHNVKFAMIYDSWFKNLPESWLKVGELYLGKSLITPSDSVVSFYASDKQTYSETYKLLKEFSKTLPVDTRFEFHH